MTLISTLIDYFEGGSSTPDTGIWSTTTGGTGTVVVDTANDELDFSVAGTFGSNANVTSLTTDFDLTGDALVVGPVTNVTSDSIFLYFDVLVSNAAITEYYRLYWTKVGADIRVTSGKNTGSGDTSIGSSVVHNDGDYYRIRESGGTVYFDRSSDNYNWSNITSESTSMTITNRVVKIRIVAQLSATGTGTIGNVNPEPPPPPPPPPNLGKFFFVMNK